MNPNRLNLILFTAIYDIDKTKIGKKVNHNLKEKMDVVFLEENILV